MSDDELQLPPDLDPHDEQIPLGLNPADADRFRLAFAIGRLMFHADNPAFVRALFESDLPTGNLAAKLDAQPTDR